MYVYVRTRMWLYAHMCMHAQYKHVSVHARPCTHMRVAVRTHVCRYMHVCVHVRVCEIVCGKMGCSVGRACFQWVWTQRPSGHLGWSLPWILRATCLCPFGVGG